LQIVHNTTLSNDAVLSLANNKTLISDVTLADDSSLLLSGILKGDVDGSGTLEIKTAKSKVLGAIDGVKLALGKMKTNLSNLFSGSIGENDNIDELKLTGTTLVADKEIYGLNKLSLNNNSSLTLTNNLYASSADINGSKLYLGTNNLDVSGGTVNITDKSSIYLDVTSKQNYGKITADEVNIQDGAKNITLNVTMKPSDKRQKWLDLNGPCIV